MLNSIPHNVIEASDRGLQSTTATPTSVLVTQNVDPIEARLEAAEISKYLLAKSFFDCREYDRCASVFLPDSLLSGVLSAFRQDRPDLFSDDPHSSAVAEELQGHENRQRSFTSSRQNQHRPDRGMKSRSSFGHQTSPKATSNEGAVDKEKANANLLDTEPKRTLPELSQKSLFLALYAKLISGEKKKDEEVEMVMGPHDTGDIANRQLQVIGAYLQTWFEQNMNEDGEKVVSQGWLEYLYDFPCP